MSKDGRACNQSFGRFVVREIVCSTGNTIERLAVDAEQHRIARPPTIAETNTYASNSTVPEIVPAADRQRRTGPGGDGGWKLVQFDGLYRISGIWTSGG